MSLTKKSSATAFYRNWREPIWGVILSDILVAGDILVETLELPSSPFHYLLTEAVQHDVLRLAILLLGPVIGFVLRYFRMRQEKLFQDIVHTMIYILDHEIRNPLMLILGASSLLQKSDPDEARRLRQVGEAVDRIVETLSNLSTMQHITASKFYDIRDHLKASTTPAKDLKTWGMPTTIVRVPNKLKQKKPEDPG